jgi:hypothetical protein
MGSLVSLHSVDMLNVLYFKILFNLGSVFSSFNMNLFVLYSIQVHATVLMNLISAAVILVLFSHLLFSFHSVILICFWTFDGLKIVLISL